MFMIPKTFSSVNLLAQILFMASFFIHKKENQKTNDLPFLSKMVRCYFFIKKQRFISKIPPYKRNISLIMF